MLLLKTTLLMCSLTLWVNMTGCSVKEPEEKASPSVVEASIAGIQRDIQAGKTSCREIVTAYLARIEAYDKPAGINAITVVNPAALEAAASIDARLAAGEELGPLFCAPLLIKDNYQTHDMVTTAGSVALAGYVPPRDAFMVRKLRAADAIVLAKTNMAEWAFSPRHSNSSSFGETANAYDIDYTPAGSSGGTASAVAASFAVAGFGSDTGNSIRGPASHLALFGIRSTIGLTSRNGIVPLSFDRDIAGPMTRSVEDGARLFDVIAGYDPDDPYTELGRGKREQDYRSFLDAQGLQGARIGVLRDHVDTEDADPDIIAIFEQAVVDLQSAGALIVDPFVIPGLDEYRQMDIFCPRFRYDIHTYTAGLGADVPLRDVNTLLESGQFTDFGKGVLEYFSEYPLDIHPAQWDQPCLDYAANPLRQGVLATVVQAMDAAEVDVIIYPTWTQPPARLASAVADYAGDNSQFLSPTTGMPAVSVPMGWWKNSLPAGLQILGRPYSEGMLIQFSYAYEQATHHRHSPPGFDELK